MSVRSFNQAPPTTEPRPLYAEYAIGWQHSVEGEGADARIVYVLDEAGQPVPTTYTVSLVVNGGQLLEASNRIATLRGVEAGDSEKEIAEKLDVKNSDLTFFVEALGAILGDDVVRTVGADPTVEPAAFVSFIYQLVEDLHLDQLFGGLGNG